MVKTSQPSSTSEALPYVLTLIVAVAASGTAVFETLGFTWSAVYRWIECSVISWAVMVPVLFFLIPAFHGVLGRIVAQK